MKKVAKTPLTEKQRLFAEYYAETYNASLSYFRAYGGSYKTANSQGPKLSKDPRVIEYVKELQKINWAAKAVTYERIADELSKIAFGDGNKRDKLTALNLLQRQMGLDKQNITAEVNSSITFVDDLKPDED